MSRDYRQTEPQDERANHESYVHLLNNRSYIPQSTVISMEKSQPNAHANERHTEISDHSFARGFISNHHACSTDGYDETLHARTIGLQRPYSTQQMALTYERPTTTVSGTITYPEAHNPSSTSVTNAPTNTVNAKSKGYIKLGTFDGTSELHLFLRR